MAVGGHGIELVALLKTISVHSCCFLPCFFPLRCTLVSFTEYANSVMHTHEEMESVWFLGSDVFLIDSSNNDFHFIKCGWVESEQYCVVFSLIDARAVCNVKRIQDLNRSFQNISSFFGWKSHNLKVFVSLTLKRPVYSVSSLCLEMAENLDFFSPAKSVLFRK